MRIAMTGSKGLVGTEIANYLMNNRHELTRIVRPQTAVSSRAKTAHWDIVNAKVDTNGLEDQDVIIHLAGANIAAHRWSKPYKTILRDSRVKGTKFLAETLTKLQKPPKLLICASAVGFYGVSNDSNALDESSPAGDDFLAGICKEWEEASAPAQSAGVRVIYARFGVVLSSNGGALAKMLPIFKYGLGGRLGHGRQIMSWIALKEIPPIIMHLILSEEIKGAVNIVAPYPVSNAEFTKILGRVIKRSAISPVPAISIKWLFGEMGKTLFLNGASITPKRLQESGYKFQYPMLQSALQACFNYTAY